MFDFLIVGAGYSGCVLAERIATQLDKRVLIVDRRNHVGGLAYDYYNDNGILVNKHGLHGFFTNSQEVFQYLSRFTKWHFYSPIARSYVDGMLVPFPINIDTINQLYGMNIQSQKEVEDFFDSVKENISNPQNAEEMILSQIGRDLYKKFYKNYTLKYWKIDPKELDKYLTARIPVRSNRDPRFNTDTYQGFPKQGYTAMFQKMVDRPNISVLLQTDYRSIVSSIKYDRLIYTGAIDEFFDYMYGQIRYRSLRFEYETLDREYYQDCMVVTYPNDYEFSRILEFKHATGQKHHKTTIVREYPMSEEAGGERYYPIPIQENEELFKKYKQETEKLKAVTFCGRHTSYKYYSMAQAVAQALMIFKTAIAS